MYVHGDFLDFLYKKKGVEVDTNKIKVILKCAPQL